MLLILLRLASLNELRLAQDGHDAADFQLGRSSQRMFGIVLDEKIELGAGLVLLGRTTGGVCPGRRQLQPRLRQLQRQEGREIGGRVLALTLQVLERQIGHTLCAQAADELQDRGLVGP